MRTWTFLCTICMVALGFGVPVGAADYTTPGSGSTYSLADIVNLTTGGTVSGAAGVFVLNGNLTISPNDSLSIGAGESLTAAADPSTLGFALMIKGRILVQGTSGSPAVLTASSTQPGGWRGIQITATTGAASEIRYADISKARIGVHVRGTVAPLIEYNTIHYNLYAGVAVSPNATATIQYNDIQSDWDWSTGVVLSGAVNTQVTTNTLIVGESALYSSGSQSSTLIADNLTSVALAGMVSAGFDASVIQANTLENGYLGAVAANDSNAEWRDNSIGPQTLGNMASTNAATPLVRENTFHDSGTHGGFIIFNDSLPNLGSDLEDGNNTFLNHPEWDLINFSSLNQMANGNNWSYPPPGTRIYDYSEDVGDPDGNAIQSGWVFLNGVSEIVDWLYY